jgi:hypothetical protein
VKRDRLAAALALGALAALLPAAPGDGPLPGQVSGAVGRASRPATSRAVPSQGGGSAPSLPERRDAAPELLLRRGALARALHAGTIEHRRASPAAGEAKPLPLAAVAGLEAAGLLGPTAPPLRVAGVEHEPYVLIKQGLPVFNRTGRLHRRDGRLHGVTGRLRLPPPTSADFELPAERAVALATARAGVRELRAPARAERGLFARPDGTVAAWRVRLASARPLGSFEVVVHAASGEILDFGDRLRRVTGTGFVYPENPVSTPALAAVSLPELDASGSLKGRFVRVFDARDVEAFRPDSVFSFPPGDPRLAQTAVYRGLSEAALFAESHGVTDLPGPVPAFTNVPAPGSGGEDEFNNAFYDPFFPLFAFGNGDGLVTANLGLDFDVAAHELGHHVFETLVTPQASESLQALAAVNEGVADTVAALVVGNPAIGESTLPGQPFLRNVDNTRHFPEDVAESPHETGLIFAGLNWDLVEALGRDTAARILFAALPYLPPDLRDPAGYRDALIQADRDVTGGRNSGTISNLALQRGLDFYDQAGFEGFLEEGSPETRSLSFRDVDFFFFFSEFPGSRELLFRTSGTGDVALFVAPLSNPDLFLVSDLRGTSTESLRLTQSTNPSVDYDDVWAIAVQANTASLYTLEVTTLLPAPGIAIGGSRLDRLDLPGEVDLVTFAGSGGQVVSLGATALDPDLDLVAVIFDPATGDALAGDDDDGPGSDPLIQGARLPATRTYAIAVFTLFGDVDPGVGTGGYRIDLASCANLGPDLDGDTLVDLCDDDDDGDGFDDPVDAGPRSPLSCADVEEDGCEDCFGGSFDPFADGVDSDGDALCDFGDGDDDNDGCADAVDPARLAPSVDDDRDFVGLDCDNCPEDANPAQTDTDADGLGDACDPTPGPEPGAALALGAALAGAAGLARLARPRGSRPAAQLQKLATRSKNQNAASVPIP